MRTARSWVWSRYLPANLEGLPVPLIGIYDLVLEDPAGIITIVDHKTASKSYTMADANQNLQMTIYHMAARTNGYGERDLLLRLDVSSKPKSQSLSSTILPAATGKSEEPSRRSRPSGRALPRGVHPQRRRLEVRKLRLQDGLPGVVSGRESCIRKLGCKQGLGTTEPHSF